MRILAVNEFYPPFYYTGYDLGCRDIVEALRKRGHDVEVLTAKVCLDEDLDEKAIDRRLRPHFREKLDWRRTILKELVNQTAFKRVCAEFDPEAALFFNLSFVSASLGLLAGDLAIPSVYYLADFWFLTYQKDHWFQTWPKGPKGARAVRPEKRLDTAIRALGILKRVYGLEEAALTVVGCNPWDPSPQAPYQKAFRSLVKTSGFREDVRFIGWRPHELLPSLYREHDILIYPGSQEGITSLALLEAMACGLAVVGIKTPGHAEILEDGKNGLIFAGGDAEDCARQVSRLLRDPALFESVQTRARSTIEQNFRLETTAGAIESVLKKACASSPASQRAAFSEKHSFLEDPAPGLPLGRMAARAERSLRLGALAVTARTLFRPGFFRQKGKKLITKTVSTAMVITVPRLMEFLFRLAGRRSGRSTDSAMPPRRILVVQPADLGDILLSGPFLRELRRHRPDAWIGLAVQPSMVSLVAGCPYIDEIIPYRWRSFKDWGTAFSGHPRWWVQAAWLSFRKLWKHNIDTAVSLRWNNDAPQAAALTLMLASGASERVGYRDTPRDLIPCRVFDINKLITRGPVRTFLQHEVEMQMELLRSLGAAPSDTRLEIWTSSADEAFARDLISREGFQDASPLIALAPGAAWSFRRWPQDRYVFLGRWLQEDYGASVVILAGPNERALTLRIERGLIKDRTLNLAGRTTIMQMAAVLKRCHLFIGNDSGPVHVAAAAGVPVVGFFGPGEYERFKPWGVRNEAIRIGLPCSPCSQNCAFDDPRCIRGISLDRAKEVIAGILKSLGRLPLRP